MTFYIKNSMSVAKFNSSGPPNSMKSDERINPFEIFGQLVPGRGDNPVQWMPIIHHFGHPDLRGLSLLGPFVVEPQKCDKCSREFCSPMNYRRHIRMHRRSLNVDKESNKNRELLGAFWDKLSLEEAGKFVSFDDVSMEGVSGSLIVDAWANSLHKPGVMVFPQLYLSAGTILLEIIQANSSRLSIPSQDLFRILDETSEGTFLCAGTAESVQRFVIDGGVKKSLEMRNLIASISLLFEQKLVKAWLAEKDVEALRCQKILVEEEEVAQKRKVQRLEKKKRRSLRQKEQGKKSDEKASKNVGKMTDNNVVEKIDGNIGEKIDGKVESTDFNDNSVKGPTSTETSIPQFIFDNGSDTLTNVKSCSEQINFSGKESEEFVEANCDYSRAQTSMDSIKSFGSHEWETDGLYQSTMSTWEVVPKSYRRSQVTFLGSQCPQTFKLKARQKQDPSNEKNIVANGGMFQARKSKFTIDEKRSRTTIPNIVSKREIDVGSSRTTWRDIVANSEFVVDSSRTTLPNVVENNANDVGSSKASWKNIVAKGAIGVESSRSTFQNVVAKVAHDVESSRASLHNIVAKGEIGVESSRTTSKTVVAESENDVESSKASLHYIVAKGAVGIENSRTTLQNVVAKPPNDLESSKSSLLNIVSKGTIGVESSRTALQNAVEKSANDVQSSRASWQNIVAKGAVGIDSSRTTLQNAVSITRNDVESSRTRLHNVVPSSNNDMLVGSMSVLARNSIVEQHTSQGASTDSNVKYEKSDYIFKIQDPAVAVSRDVCMHEKRGDLSTERDNQNFRKNPRMGAVEAQNVTSLQHSLSKTNDIVNNSKNSYMERNVQTEGAMFSSFDARAFLAHRWKDVIASDHVKLVLSPEPHYDTNGRKGCSLIVHIPGCHRYSELGDAGTPVSSSTTEREKGNQDEVYPMKGHTKYVT